MGKKNTFVLQTSLSCCVVTPPWGGNYWSVWDTVWFLCLNDCLPLILSITDRYISSACCWWITTSFHSIPWIHFDCKSYSDYTWLWLCVTIIWPMCTCLLFSCHLHNGCVNTFYKGMLCWHQSLLKESVELLPWEVCLWTWKINGKLHEKFYKHKQYWRLYFLRNLQRWTRAGRVWELTLSREWLNELSMTRRAGRGCVLVKVWKNRYIHSHREHISS